ncbi:hypothetical protein [Flagellimonas meridianipacifica]|uniref:Uncharacterized protein n=1 Tax=Flagellimonas meridianipacifica TaxID=1080225 RepID=A0A2T0MH41_9FLAO|nr:hypothetical protein [Allomuricauda pacifica]PRX56893.1 hypothetical protein CLV81_0893 [Allomuricauda pacifica]
MPLKSSFKTDLAKEKKLTPLLDSYYQKHLTSYEFERMHDLNRQQQGIDLILTHKKTGETYFVDEKAQLDYINESLPTFAFEILYMKNHVEKMGWFLDTQKQTQFYALVTSIFSDETNVFTSCNITFVNREKLIQFLAARGLTSERMQELARSQPSFHGKMQLNHLEPYTEGCLFFSNKNKAESPVNLILKLDFLRAIGVGKLLY